MGPQTRFVQCPEGELQKRKEAVAAFVAAFVARDSSSQLLTSPKILDILAIGGAHRESARD